MYVAVQHDIHDQDEFRRKVNSMAPPPSQLQRHQFFTATDLTRAVCLWETPSVAPLQDYIDGSLLPASTQTYIPINEERAVGLPASKVA